MPVKKIASKKIATKKGAAKKVATKKKTDKKTATKKTAGKKKMSIAECARAQFTKAVKAAKLIRTAFGRLLFNLGDPKLNNRLSAEVMKVVQSDAIHEHGLKTATTGNLGILKGFEFNGWKPLQQFLFADFTVSIDRQIGRCTVNFPAFLPGYLVKMQPGATYFRLILAASTIDFDAATYHTDIASSGYFSPRKEAELVLCAQVPVDTKLPIVVLLGIQYYKKFNDQYLLMYSGGPMALSVVHTDQLLPVPQES